MPVVVELLDKASAEPARSSHSRATDGQSNTPYLALFPDRCGLVIFAEKSGDHLRETIGSNGLG